MRLILTMVFAGSVASPLSVSAQADDQGTRTSTLQEGQYYVQPPRFSVQRARNGLIASSVILVGGAALTAGMVVRSQNTNASLDDTGRVAGLGIGLALGVSMAIGGIVGLGISARRFKVAKGDRELYSAGFGCACNQRRVQWDLARSRVVF